MSIKDVLMGLPDYREFMSIDELNESSLILAERHPGVVRLFRLGESARGSRYMP